MFAQTIPVRLALAIVSWISDSPIMKNKVDLSVEAPGGTVCVDIFQRPDGSWGLEEYRRDAEDGTGWFATGFFAETPYDSRDSAISAAHELVPWFREIFETEQ